MKNYGSGELLKVSIPQLEYALGTGDGVVSRIGFDRCTDRSGRRFKNRFADVMTVATVVQLNVKIAQQICRHRLPKIFDQFTVKIADLWRRKAGIEHHEIPAAQIDGGRHQRFFHRQGKMAVATNSLFVAQRFSHHLTDADTSVFDGVMLVNVQVSIRVNGQIDQRVFRKQLQHMIEKSDSSLNRRLPRSVQIDFYRDFRFVRVSF